VGENNNEKVAARYKNCLPGNSPEMMPLDCHLFANLKEGAARNVALTFHIIEKDQAWPLKYSFATPAKVFKSLQRTITEGCSSVKRISQDVNQVFEETLGRIVMAKGCYIKDSSLKILQNDVRRVTAEEHKQESIPVDAAAMTVFKNMVEKMKNGEGVSFLMESIETIEIQNDTLTSVPTIVEDKEDEDGEGQGEGQGEGEGKGSG
jgi:hypothetical protein